MNLIGIIKAGDVITANVGPGMGYIVGVPPDPRAPAQPDGRPAAPGNVVVSTSSGWVNLGSAPAGSPGLPGARGPEGPRGSEGPRGPDGPRGSQGEGIHIRGTVADAASLPTGGVVGDLWITANDGHGHASDGTGGWVDVGPLRGPTGLKGDAATVTVASTTTGAPGTQATVTNVGDTQNVRLAITIPRGDPGTPTQWDITGTGFPEGTVAAAPGTRYTDIAATNGAVQWVKMTGTGPTGWTVAFGDTGMRYLPFATINGWTLSTIAAYSSLRRVGAVVALRMYLSAAAPPTARKIATLPHGFRPDQSVVMLQNMDVDPVMSHGSAIQAGDDGSLLWADWQPMPTGRVIDLVSGQWLTSEPWPTTLPGNP